jgi:hypothetical protein
MNQMDPIDSSFRISGDLLGDACVFLETESRLILETSTR